MSNLAALLDLHGEDARRFQDRVGQITAALPLGARLGVRLLDAIPDMLLGRQGLDALKVVALLAAAVPSSLAVSDPVQEPILDCTPASEWPTHSTADAIVVGSGAGGAMAARTLALAGLSVLVVEEGRRHTAAEFSMRPPLDRFLDLYRDAGATFAVGRPPIMMPVGRGVGGTTLVNCGTSYRTPDRVLNTWKFPIVNRFPSLLDEVERTLTVAPAPLELLGRNGHLAIEGATALGWAAAPLRRNAPGCVGSSQCIVGCPRNAKHGVHLNALPQACSAGARIITHARVDRIIHERGRATGIRAGRLHLFAPIIIIAAGATQTPPLLSRSGLARHPQAGRGLAIHPAVSIAGRFLEPVNAWSGVMQSVGIEALHDRGILIEATGTPPGLGTFLLPGRGPALRAELDAAEHLAFLGAMVADQPSGRVHRRFVTYRLARQDAAKLRTAMIAMGNVLFAAGATEILTGLARHPQVSSADELRDAIETTPTRELHVAAFHPTGSMRMGRDPSRTPVDENGALRGINGVHIADGSVLPTCPEVNPQLSIMAMALGIAQNIVEWV